MVGRAGRRSGTGDSGPVRAVGTAPDPWGRGLVAAEIETDGHRLLAVRGWAERGWSAAEAVVLGGADAAAAAEVQETAQAELLSRFPDAAVIGIFDPPRAPRSAPPCDGAVLAEALRRPVVWDFNAACLRMGGQDAPLTGLYHHALLRHLGLDGPAAVLALDGVPRLTWADCAGAEAAAPGVCLGFDLAPALPPPRTASRGEISVPVLDRAMGDPFLRRMPPRLLAAADFAQLRADLAALPEADAAPTLLAVVAAATAESVEVCPAPPKSIVLTGASARDLHLVGMLEARLGVPLVRIDRIAAIDPAAVTAEAAAFSAVRVLRGLPTSVPGTSGLAAAVGGAEVSRPAL